MSILDQLFPEHAKDEGAEEVFVVDPDEYLEGDVGFSFRHLLPTPST